MLRMVVLVFLECTFLKNPEWKKESCLDFGLPGRFWKSDFGNLEFVHSKNKNTGVLEFWKFKNDLRMI